MKPIWIIRHVDYERLGHIPSVLDELQLPYRSISWSLGDPLPSLHDLGEVSGVITMGGPMSAYEKPEHAWIGDEETFLREAHARNIPILGICLGAQILAQAFGAKVHKAPQVEVGWVAVEKTTDEKSRAMSDGQSVRDPLLEGLSIPPLFHRSMPSALRFVPLAIALLSSNSTSNLPTGVGTLIMPPPLVANKTTFSAPATVLPSISLLVIG